MTGHPAIDLSSGAFDEAENFGREVDCRPLKGQRKQLFDLMSDGNYRTIVEIIAEIGGGKNTVAANLRDLRKPQFGGYIVHCRKTGQNKWDYAIKMEAGSGATK